MHRLSMEQIVNEVNDLPALPSIAAQVFKLVEDPSSTVQDMNDLINQDQALTAKVLRLANSAYYGFPRRISSVTEATVLLGFNTIKSIVMAASVSKMMQNEIKGYALPPGELWRHSQSCAIAARLIASKVKFKNPDLAYTAGLLHDIGKLILNHHLQNTYQDVINLIMESTCSFSDAEEKILGFNHATVGAKVVDKWNLPVDLIEAVEFHHNPELVVHNKQLTSIVHLADALCLMMGIGLGIDGLTYPLANSALEILDQSIEDVEQIASNLIDIWQDQDAFNLNDYKC